MDTTDDVLLDVFKALRDDLKRDNDVGLALKAEGPDVSLRIRSQSQTDDEKQPFFAVVVASSDGAYRISYNPSGFPSAERQVMIVGAESADELLGIVRGYLDAERHRAADYSK